MTEKVILNQSNEERKRGNRRIDLVDSLRGFALLAIVLLHNLEHYNLFCIPENMPEQLVNLDKGVWDTIFFFLAGKAYATFSLLFGFSFYIQFRNEEKRGGDFRARFAWRMLILALIAQVHALFYNGDILLLYSVVGLLLIPVSKLSTRTVVIIALICLAQPIEWIRLVYGYFNPETSTYGEYFLHYAKLCDPVMRSGGFFDILKSNITDGQLYSNLWQLENGRFFQSAGLFMMGMLLGRKKYFINGRRANHFWKRLLIAASMLFIPFHLMKTWVVPTIDSEIIHRSFGLISGTYTNLALMCVLVSLLVLLWFNTSGTKLQKMMIPYGRMSLTNYITQSIIGVAIYYGFGLGLYKYTGATFSILIGLGIFALQLIFSRYWLSTHKQGPMEWVWRKLTWIGNDKNNR